MTVGELQSRLSSKELTEWIAYQRVVGPLGPKRADALFSYIVQTLYAVNTPKGKKPPKLEKVMPTWGADEIKKPATPEDWEAQRRAFTSMVTGKRPSKGTEK